MLPQYSDKTSKSKRGSRLDKISNTIKGGIFYTTGWTMPELLCACLSGGFVREPTIERCSFKLHPEWVQIEPAP